MQSALLANIAVIHWNRTNNWAETLTAFVKDGRPVPCQYGILEEVCNNCKRREFARFCVLRNGLSDVGENAFVALRGMAVHEDVQMGCRFAGAWRTMH